MKLMNSSIKGLAILIFINQITISEYQTNIVKAEALQNNQNLNQFQEIISEADLAIGEANELQKEYKNLVKKEHHQSSSSNLHQESKHESSHHHQEQKKAIKKSVQKQKAQKHHHSLQSKDSKDENKKIEAKTAHTSHSHIQKESKKIQSHHEQVKQEIKQVQQSKEQNEQVSKVGTEESIVHENNIVAQAKAIQQAEVEKKEEQAYKISDILSYGENLQTIHDKFNKKKKIDEVPELQIVTSKLEDIELPPVKQAQQETKNQTAQLVAKKVEALQNNTKAILNQQQEKKAVEKKNDDEPLLKIEVSKLEDLESEKSSINDKKQVAVQKKSEKVVMKKAETKAENKQKEKHQEESHHHHHHSEHKK